MAAGGFHQPRTYHSFNRLTGVLVPPQVHKALQRQGVPAGIGWNGVAVNAGVFQEIAVGRHIVVGFYLRNPSFRHFLGGIVQPGGQGISLHREDLAIFHIQHQANMVNPAGLQVLEQHQVPLLGDVCTAPGGAVLVASQSCESPAVPGAVHRAGKRLLGHLSLVGTPRDKHVAPEAVGIAVALAEHSELIGSFRIAHLPQCPGHYLPGLGKAVEGLGWRHPSGEN